MTSTEFRKELVKLMPGYNWTVHKQINPDYLDATGIQTSGFNRLSTVHVGRLERGGKIKYEVKSAGFGTRAPWLASRTDGTLARAFRSLQTHYESVAQQYGSHGRDLANARISKESI